MYKSGVIGERDSVMGFMSCGFTVSCVESAEEASKALKKMANEDYAVIFITEDTAQMIEEEIEKYRQKPIPAIILIPGKDGSLGIGMAKIKDSVERAIGADILK